MNCWNCGKFMRKVQDEVGRSYWLCICGTTTVELPKVMTLAEYYQPKYEESSRWEWK